MAASRFLPFNAVIRCILLFVTSAGPGTNSRPAVAPSPALVRTAAEAAGIIGGTCKASWLKQQAREGRIPYVRLGGAYNFTDAHIAAILGIFEHLPAVAAT